MSPIRICSTVLLLTLYLALIRPERARAQEHAQVVWDQLKLHHELMTNANYQFLQYIISSERQSGKSEWTFAMNGGTSYALTAACDNDCGDVDIRVKNSYGELLSEDADASDNAVVEFNPSVSGQYVVEVEMYQCDQEPCYYGVGMFYQTGE